VQETKLLEQKLEDLESLVWKLFKQVEFKQQDLQW